MVAFAPLLSQEITASLTPGSTVMLIGGPGMAAAIKVHVYRCILINWLIWPIPLTSFRYLVTRNIC